MSYRAFICGIQGVSITADEIAFLREARPSGVILFKRNCETPSQLLALTSEIRTLFGDETYPILIDQEGGRVQRLNTPHWPKQPPARAYCDACGGATEAALAAAYSGARLIAHDLRAVGVNVNCAPVLDVPAPGAHDIIGDRAYGRDAATVTAFGRAVAQAHLDSGVLPIVKHIPGHGRANADSHLSLPVVSAQTGDMAETDFRPFRDLNDMPIAMTAHILFTDIDADRPASASPAVIHDIIRNHIGFDGLLMCDDVSMHALTGGLGERTRAVLAAGCDVALHCNGRLEEMTAVANAAPMLSGDALRRYDAALARLAAPEPFDHERARARLRETLADWA